MSPKTEYTKKLDWVSTVIDRFEWARLYKYCTVVCLAVLACGVWATTATAQDVRIIDRAQVRRGETVAHRPRPELDALGVRVGGFRIFPNVDVEEQYNDNIFARRTGKKIDKITFIRPTVVVRSDWRNHFLELESGGDISIHANNTREDYENYRVGGKGRFDVSRNTYARGSVMYRVLHESRSSPDDLGSSKPTKFTNLYGTADVYHSFGRFNATVSGIVDRFNFRDSQSIILGVPVTNNGDDRDRTQYTGALRLGYQIQPRYEAFVRSAYINRRYDTAIDDNGFDRDSMGYEMVGGLEVDFGGLMFGDFFGGYRLQNIDDSTFRSIKGETYGAELTWIPTGLTTVTGNVVRTISETTLVGTPGGFRTEFGVTVDHELLRNLIVSAETVFRREDFKQINRQDDRLRAGININYMMNRRIYLILGYTHERRNSNVARADFSRNLVRIRLRMQL